MRAWLLVIPLFGCEMDVPPKKVPPPPDLPMSGEFPDLQFLDVKVREYGTDVPIAGATIDLVQLGEEPKRLSAVTDESGMKRFELEWPKWTVERVTAPGGYLTGCPTSYDEETRHSLVVETRVERDVLSRAQVLPPARTIYTCRPVSPSALVVRDKKVATKLAKAVPEIATWLRSNRDARVTQIELIGIHWEVRLETPHQRGIELEDNETRLVGVDGLDQHAYVLGRWGGD